ncbi:MAG: uroporphyrinogen-III synthase [Proteobacteria bacterium]|nr:uroporphyrinogen-III synthase [Pseudomonadota bacterium]
MNPLTGKRILITRDASQSGSLSEKLTDLGAEVISISTISIADPPKWCPFDEAARQLPKFDWILFSSVNAVIRTNGRLLELSLDLKSYPDLKIAAVGSQTAKVAEENGWRVDLIPARFQAEGLLQALLSIGVSENEIWLPRALKAREHLPDELRKAGANVMVTPVYQNTVPYENGDRLNQTLARGDIDWITFTSSSTAANFFKILGRDLSQEQLPKLASIGTLTTRTLNDLSLEPQFTADPQNLDGLCRGILKWEENPHD